MTFDQWWATTGPWPNNILGTAFKELAQKAYTAGRAATLQEVASRAMSDSSDEFWLDALHFGRILDEEGKELEAKIR